MPNEAPVVFPRIVSPHCFHVSAKLLNAGVLRFDRHEHKGTKLGGEPWPSPLEKVAPKRSSHVLEHGTEPRLNKDVGRCEKAFLYGYVLRRNCALVPYGKKCRYECENDLNSNLNSHKLKSTLSEN